MSKPFEYAVLRVVPRVERGECINAAVVLYSQAERFLGARVHLDPARLKALDPEADLDGVGLSAMRERALVMGARLVIASVPGGGTRVRVSVPYREPGGAPARRPGPRG